MTTSPSHHSNITTLAYLAGDREGDDAGRDMEFIFAVGSLDLVACALSYVINI